ncbi:MAG: hypothetical protein EP333_07965 [Bacteroidetes bacterium]|nr:MAG: hypothetical protein EP333_07965 [Bacteroidota bacterium]
MEMIDTANCTVTPWSGGKTTELFIFPKNAEFQSGNFDFRISTATVEIEQSSYTPFPGFIRDLLVIEGEITLQHDSPEKHSIRRGESYQFTGDRHTYCVGLATNFNIIHKPQIKCRELKLHEYSDEKIISHQLQKDQIFFLFVQRGMVLVLDQEQELKVNEKMLIFISTEKNIKIILPSETSVITAIMEY